MEEDGNTIGPSGDGKKRAPRRVRIIRDPSRRRTYIEGTVTEPAALANDALLKLEDRVRAIEAAYNPDKLDLHFGILAQADDALFAALHSIGREAWDVIRLHQSGAHWFYSWFLLITGGSLRARKDLMQAAVSRDVIVGLAVLLIEISGMTEKLELQGDITKRNHEALAGLMVAFGGSSSLINTVRAAVNAMHDPRALECFEGAIASARDIEQRGKIDSSS